MNNLKKILIATDFSEQSQFSISRAIDIAKTTKAELIIMHVAQKDFFDKIIMGIIPLANKIFMKPKEYATQLLKSQIKELSRHKLKIHYVVVASSHPAIKILQYVRSHKIDLLVIGAHGKYSIHDWFVGTTAEYITRKTICPVLIVKKLPKKTYQKILVPVDFSAASRMALQFAGQLFSKKNLHILHVGDHEYADLLKKESNLSKEKLKAMRQAILHFLSDKTKQFIKKCNNKFTRFPHTVKLGYPGTVIIKEAQQLKQDLVVMGTKGHSQMHYIFLGRVASRVLIEIDKDILLVPPT